MEEKLNFKGYLSVYDENNNLLFTKENMIVKSGRKKILECAFGNSALTFSKAVLGSSNALTTEETVYSKINETKIAEINITQPTDGAANTLTKVIEFTATASGYDQLHEISFVLNDNDNDVLFSRVLLPPYPFINGSTYTFKYTIYF